MFLNHSSHLSCVEDVRVGSLLIQVIRAGSALRLRKKLSVPELGCRCRVFILGRTWGFSGELGGLGRAGNTAEDLPAGSRCIVGILSRNSLQCCLLFHNTRYV